MPDNLRARLFVDFWNLTLSCRDRTPGNYRLDWRLLSPHLVSEAQSLLGTPRSHEGTNVYLSFDPKAAKDKNLHQWATTVLDRFPGIRVVIKDRKAKNPPVCPSCHQSIISCPHCNSSTVGTIEKGIDTAIVTDMISLAWEGAWDVAILLSSDRDFIPTVEYLTTKGKRVINVHFPPTGMDLARACWASIDLAPHLGTLART